jgi:hypothetical protein
MNENNNDLSLFLLRGERTYTARLLSYLLLMIPYAIQTVNSDNVWRLFWERVGLFFQVKFPRHIGYAKALSCGRLAGSFGDDNGRVGSCAERDCAVFAFAVPAKLVTGPKKIEVLKNIKEFVFRNLIALTHNGNCDLFFGQADDVTHTLILTEFIYP